MADSVPSTKVCRNCKQAKPADQFISKTKSSITRGRLTANCLGCRNRQASGASKRTAEQAELSPICRERLPLIDLQLRTPINSPAAKPHEAVAHVGACSSSAGDGQDGNDVSWWERKQGDETTGGGVDVVAAAGKRLGRLSTYDSLANAASAFRQIQPKQPAVEDTAWRQHAEAIARSLPRRPLRGGLRSNRVRKSHDAANSGGSARHQPSGQLENGELRGTGEVSGPGTSAWQPPLPREHGAPEAANSEPPRFHRHFLPQERGPEDDEQGGTAAASDASLFRRNEAPAVRIIQPKQSVSGEDISRRELAAAITRGLPKRRRRRGRRPKARPHTSHVSDAAGLAQHALLAQARDGDVRVNVDDAAAEPEDAALVRKTLLPKVASGAVGAAVAEPVLSHRHVLPKENRRGDEEEEDGMAAVAQRECGREGSSMSRMRLRIESVRRHALQPLVPKERDGAVGDAHLAEPSLTRSQRQMVCGKADQVCRDEAVDLRQPQRQGKRNRNNSRDEPPRKQIRAGGIRRQRRREMQVEDLASVLGFLEEDFAVKERLSNEQTWCTPVSQERKVLTVRDFYQAFHNASTLPIWTCMLCYRKCAKKELREVTWDRWMSSCVEKGDRSPFSCRSCFPVGDPILSCAECMSCLRRGGLSPAAQLHVRLGCEHMFPDELKGLTLVEEKLIALNSCYGFVTRYSVPGGQRQSLRYPRHVKGHITVFPNNVQELATKVLPHPLLQVMDEIC